MFVKRVGTKLGTFKAGPICVSKLFVDPGVAVPVSILGNSFSAFYRRIATKMEQKGDPRLPGGIFETDQMID